MAHLVLQMDRLTVDSPFADVVAWSASVIPRWHSQLKRRPPLFGSTRTPQSEQNEAESFDVELHDGNVRLPEVETRARLERKAAAA